MMGCDEELCPNWSGDGMVCPCAIFGLERVRCTEDCPEDCSADHQGEE